MRPFRRSDSSVARRLPVRRGYSLIQLLTIIMTMTILVGIGATIITTLLRTQAQLQEHLRVVRLRSRLGRVLAEDVHAMQAAAWESDQSRLILSRQDERVSYQVVDGRLVREAFSGEAKSSQEEFPLGTQGAEFALVPPDAPVEVSLTLSGNAVRVATGRIGQPTRNSPLEQVPAGVHRFIIRARLNRDQRFVAGGTP